jgi:hypothetical protein
MRCERRQPRVFGGFRSSGWHTPAQALIFVVGLGLGCGKRVEHIDTCSGPYGTRQIGESFEWSCKSCVCNEDETVTCSDPQPSCAVCEYQGESYSLGESFPAGDGCNVCLCHADGSVTCSDAMCGEVGPGPGPGGAGGSGGSGGGGRGGAGGSGGGGTGGVGGA